MTFESLDDPARGLLITTCDILNGTGSTYVVAGGWIPVLRGGAEGLTHPGTRDVDLLFPDDPDTIELAVRALLLAGFYLSAKHVFQLLVPIEVGDQRFIFNVDLMHQGEFRGPADLYEDLFDTGIPDGYDPTGKRRFKSIVFPSSAVIFDEHMWSLEKVTATKLDGAPASIAVPLIDECGLILSKAKSLKQDKRPRDSFDIYFVLMGPQRELIEDTLQSMCSRFPAVRERIGKLHHWLANNHTLFDQNVKTVHEIPGAAAAVLHSLNIMLDN